MQNKKIVGIVFLFSFIFTFSVASSTGNVLISRGMFLKRLDPHLIRRCCFGTSSDKKGENLSKTDLKKSQKENKSTSSLLENPLAKQVADAVRGTKGDVYEKAKRAQGLWDWMIFLSRAHEMTQEEVKKTIKTPEVLEAFEMCKFENLPIDVLTDLLKESIQKEDIEQAIRCLQELENREERVLEGIDGMDKVAKVLVLRDISTQDIAKFTGLSEERVNDLRSSKED